MTQHRVQADFSFFFDTGGRRRCYIAPERFHEGGSGQSGGSGRGPAGSGITEAPLLPAMDVFSLGCVLAELFSDGQPLFDLSQLLQYRRGELDPATALESLPDALRDLILHMIQLDPRRRLGAAEYLDRWGPRLFPRYFAARLHAVFDSMLDLNPDERVAALEADFDSLRQELTGKQPQTALPEADASVSRNTGQQGTPISADVSPNAPGGGSSAPAGSMLAGVGALLQDTRALMDRLQDGSPPGGGSAETTSPSGGAAAAFPLSTPTASAAGRFQYDEQYLTPGATPGSDQLREGERLSERRRSHEEASSRPAAVEGGSGVSERAGSVPFAEGMVLVAALLCTVVRGAKQQELKVSLWLSLPARCDDSQRDRGADSQIEGPRLIALLMLQRHLITGNLCAPRPGQLSCWPMRRWTATMRRGCSGSCRTCWCDPVQKRICIGRRI